MIDYPECLPCWAPGAANYLESILTGEEVGFEWGGGASSIWLAPKIRRLMVMETDHEWADNILNQSMRKNLGLWVRDFDHQDYLGLARTCRPRPNLWLIDGYRRIECFEEVLDIAKPGDIIVCDDSADYLDGRAPAHAKTFSQPHPHAGIKINHKKYGHLKNSLLKVHHATKDTTVWEVR
jgi:hypothetical protein